MIVKMIIHSKTIHLTSQTAALLKQFVPDRMNKLEGNSALSLSVITALFRGIVTMLVWQVVTNMVRLVTNLTCHVIYYNNSFWIITKIFVLLVWWYFIFLHYPAIQENSNLRGAQCRKEQKLVFRKKKVTIGE